MNTQNKAYVLRTVKEDHTAYGGFVWPKSGHVKALDWDPNPECGNGLHGWLSGRGDSSLAIGPIWLVVEVDPTQVVDLDGKVKFPEGNVIYLTGS